MSISSFVSCGCWLVIYLIFQWTAIGSFKEQVESLQSLDTSVEILVRLLCAVPGWGEKNVQVSIYWQCLAFWVFCPIWPMTYVIPTAGSTTSNWCHHSYSFNCIKVSKEMRCFVSVWSEFQININCAVFFQLVG